MLKVIYESYFSGEEADLRTLLEGWFQDPKGYFQMGLQKLKEMRSVQGARILEVGCSTGQFLATLKKQGALVEGIDVHAKAAAYARAWYGLEIKTGRVEEVSSYFPNQYFDCLVMFELIEHVLDPVDVLRQLRPFLAKKGLLLLSTPNFDLFWRQRSGYPDLSSRFEHLHFFREKTLKLLAEKTGFQIHCLIRCGAEIPFSEQWLARSGLRPLLTYWWPRLRSFPPLAYSLRLAYRATNLLTKRAGLEKDSKAGYLLIASKSP